MYDVIIVGGGLSGLVAFRQLLAAKLDVLLLEARPRRFGVFNGWGNKRIDPFNGNIAKSSQIGVVFKISQQPGCFEHFFLDDKYRVGALFHTVSEDYEVPEIIGGHLTSNEVLVVESSRYMMKPWVTMILDLHGSGHRIKRPQKTQVAVCDGLILDLHT